MSLIDLRVKRLAHEFYAISSMPLKRFSLTQPFGLLAVLGNHGITQMSAHSSASDTGNPEATE